MKYLSISSIFLLASCQSLNPAIDSESQQALNQPYQKQDASVSESEIALPNEINQALLADVSIDIIHPIDDVTVDFTDATPKHDDLWTEISDNFILPIPPSGGCRSNQLIIDVGELFLK